MTTTVRMQVDTTRLMQVIRDLPGGLEQYLDEEAEETVTDIKLAFPATSPSPVGGPPGVDTATLRDSIRWEPTGRLERTVMDQVEYGVYQEFGTDRGLPARPWMGPAFERLRKRIEKGPDGGLDL